MKSKSVSKTDWLTVGEQGGILAAAISDLHLGHSNNDCARMVKALHKSLIHSGLISKIKLLLIAGDVYDHLLSLNDHAVMGIDRWMDRLFHSCEKYGVVVRVLRGTISHDHTQSERFELIYDVGKFTFDFKYFDTIEVEHIASLDTTILYVPDEANPTTQITQAVVEAKMQALGIEEVDIACMHGMFPHQVKFQVKAHTCHDAEYYSSLARYWVVIGHIHTHSRFGKIVTPSSHDRLRHNEEDPKGFIVFTYKCDEPQLWFIENKLAHRYVTLDCYATSVDDAMLAVQSFLSTQKERCFVRVEAENNHPIFSQFQELTKLWPEHVVAPFPNTKGVKEEVMELEDEEEGKWVMQRIDKTNITSLLSERLALKHGPEMAARCMEHLKGCL